MDFTSELIARFQAGDSVDTLAAELSKALNDAHNESERLNAKRQANVKKQQKYDAVENLLRAVRMIVIAWDLGDEVLNVITEISVDELTQGLDEAITAAKAYAEMMEKIASRREARPVADAAPKQLDQDNPIEDFLNKFVR